MSTAVVTGAGRGLGVSLVRSLCRRGVDVIGTVRNPDAAEPVRACGARVAQLDLADEVSIAAFVAGLGDEPVDLLVNNAATNASPGSGPTFGGGPMDISPEVFMLQIRTNALGPMLLTRALADRLAASDAPRVVNVSSHLGLPEVNLYRGNDVGYSASKGALNVVTAFMSRVLQPSGVIVVAVHPGWVRTDMGGPRAVLDPDEVAETMCEMIDRLTMEQSGRLLTMTGEPFTPAPPG